MNTGVTRDLLRSVGFGLSSNARVETNANGSANECASILRAMGDSRSGVRLSLLGSPMILVQTAEANAMSLSPDVTRLGYVGQLIIGGLWTDWK